MSPFLEQLMSALSALSGPDGMSRLFYMLFPAFLMFELPMIIIVLLGVLRWFARRRTSVPKISVYRPKVSCIITCYSEGMDVQTTLLSLCEQTYGGHIEMIPVVDGATVNQPTLDAVRSFKVDPQLYPKRHLRPIAKWQRGGRVSSLNAGLSLAGGEIVMALDGDTSFDNNMVASIVRHFEDPKVPAVAGSLRVRNVWGSWVTAMQALEYLLSIHMSKIGLSEWNLVNNVSGAFGAFRRSFLVKIGGWNTHTAEDLDLTLRIKSYFKRHDLRIPFEPEAVGHTDAPAAEPVSDAALALGWRSVFLYIRKHNHNISPTLLGWRTFLMILLTGFFFQLVLPFIIFIYTLLALFILPGKTLLFLFALIYLLYLMITLLMFFAMLVMVSDRPRQDMVLGLLVPFFPLFMLLLRCWSVVAMLNEIFRRGHEESSMAPWWVLSRATRF